MGTVAALNALVHTEHGWTFDAGLLAVAGTHETGTGMAFLLEHLPPHMHVAISTRADPDLPPSRWRLRGELFEIRAGVLRFTADEAAAYLNEAAELNLAAGDVAALEQRTEGLSRRCFSSLHLRSRGATTSAAFSQCPAGTSSA